MSRTMPLEEFQYRIRWFLRERHVEDADDLGDKLALAFYANGFVMHEVGS